MHLFGRTHRKTAAWLALLAMLAAALFPAVSHALAAARGEAWSPVCTAQGVRWVSDTATTGDETGGETGDEAPAPAARAFEHCPFCTQAGHTPALPRASIDAPLPTASASPLPPLALQAPRTLFAWRSAQPRAPPALD
ncbi:MAG: DUF2946 domain-containing protein [Betaproteobacteria bacterium]|nr:DUF2946 domain-containing protein [Betaproteobacteria bacterium]